MEKLQIANEIEKGCEEEGEREWEVAYVDVIWTYAKWIHKMGRREA